MPMWLGHGTGSAAADIGYTTSDANGLLALLREAPADTGIQTIPLRIYEDDSDTLEVTILNNPDRPVN